MEKKSYQKQRSTLWTHFRYLFNLFVKKGKESDVIIISLARTEGLGFLKEKRRANVATSRARDAQYVFGSSKSWATE